MGRILQTIFDRVKLLTKFSNLNSTFTSIRVIRGIAQLCSYEIIFIFLILILINFNFNFNNIFNILILILWYFTCLAELNRTPFDLLEGESELVSGFNTEFRSRRFTLLFIGEYLNL